MKNSQFKYRIERHCLWFAKHETVEVDKFLEYFTPNAVKSLIEHGYIKIISV